MPEGNNVELSDDLKATLNRGRMLRKALDCGSGLIEGVKFDFTYAGNAKLFDGWFSPEVSKWHVPEIYWGTPYIEFPWKEMRAHPRSHSGKKYVVRPGDELRIAHVDTVLPAQKFLADQDREAQCAYFQIDRKNGRSVSIPWPFYFYRYGSLLPQGMWGRLSLDTIATRIADANHIEDIFALCYCRDFVVSGATGEDLDYMDDLRTDVECFLQSAQRLVLERDAICDALDGYKIRKQEHLRSFKGNWTDIRDPRKPSGSALERLINQAVSLGYYWAQYEAAQTMLPLAESGLAVKDGASLGGKKSAQARRQKAAETWEQHALHLANTVRSNNPSASQDTVATEVDSRWKEEHSPPSHPTLKRFIRRMEAEGKLPRRLRS